MDVSNLPILVVGFLLGLRHALDADHIAAVSTIVSERKGVWTSSIVGAFWGLGHTAALLITGLAVIVFEVRIPEVFAQWLELGVAAMLIGLGVRILWKLTRGATLHVHTHEHGARVHVHPHLHETAGAHQHGVPDHHRRVRQGRQPFVVGLVHGLAGSAALMLMILATIPSRLDAFLFIGLFGGGALVGMFLMTTLIGLPVAFAARHRRLHTLIQGAAGLLSVSMGIVLSWEMASKLLAL